MAITSSDFGALLWPGINRIFQTQYQLNDDGNQWQQIFEREDSDKRYEEEVGYSGFGLAAVKREGAPLSYDSADQGFKERYENVVRSLGFIVTREMFEDNQYNEIDFRAESLADSMARTKENVGANILNNAFDSNVTYGDGKELIATDHPRVRGGTWSNELDPSADISEASIEQSCIDIMKFTDERGLQIQVMPQKLHIPPDLFFEAHRILGSPHQPDTANNAINVLNSMGKFPGGIHVNHYFTDTDAWFITTNVRNGMKMFQRRALEFGRDNDFDTDNARFKASERYSFGASDKRGVYGSQGA